MMRRTCGCLWMALLIGCSDSEDDSGGAGGSGDAAAADGGGESCMERAVSCSAAVGAGLSAYLACTSDGDCVLTDVEVTCEGGSLTNCPTVVAAERRDEFGAWVEQVGAEYCIRDCRA